MPPSVAALAAQKLRRTLGLEPRRWPTPGAMAAELDPNTIQTPALDALDALLVDLADGKTTRAACFMPPQEGKSQRCSRRFPAWLLQNDPTLRIAIVSYDLEKAVRWGRDIRRDAITHPELGITLRSDSKAAGRWHTTQGGGVYCAGIGGALTGEPVDILVIDDPVKGRAEAESLTYREAAWDWWENVAISRLSSRGKVMLMMTRWHEDDLAGRILKAEGDEWQVLTIPAIAEHPHDPLGREPGQEMDSAQRRAPGYFRRLAAKLSSYVFRSLYQGSPTAAKGSMFRRDMWRYWRPTIGQRIDLDGVPADLRDCWRFMTVDLAASTKTSADFTVASVWALTPGGRDLVLLDRVRERAEETGHAGLVRPLRERWSADVVWIESRMFGSTLVKELTRLGIPTSELRADKDKLTRAIPAANRQAARSLWIPADADWLDEWIDEHAEFPNSRFDDQVDTTAYAVRVAIGEWNPMPSDVSQIAHLQKAPDAEIDFMTQAM